MVPTHEIFQKPLKVDIQWEERPTPENYRYWPGGEKLGKTMKVWKVQAKTFPEIDHVKWGQNSSRQAFITLQRPLRIAIHARQMIRRSAS